MKRSKHTHTPAHTCSSGKTGFEDDDDDDDEGINEVMMGWRVDELVVVVMVDHNVVADGMVMRKKKWGWCALSSAGILQLSPLVLK